MNRIASLGLVQKLMSWSRRSSIFPVHLITGCCSPEEMSAVCPRYDLERFGVMPMPSLRQCDLLWVTGLVTKKMAKRVKMVYDQMPDPKYVVAFGACSISGGLFYDSYNVVKGVDKVVPVDVYVPGCPPRPEAMIQGINLIQKKIREGIDFAKSQNYDGKSESKI